MEQPRESSDLPVPHPTLVEIAEHRHRTLQQLLAPKTPALSPDDVHHLRVAARRLSEVVRLLAPLMDKPAADATRDALKSLRQAAGDLRDLDVMTGLLTRSKLPQQLRKIADNLCAGFDARRDSLVGQLHQARQAPSVTGAMVYLARLLEQPATDRARDMLATTLSDLTRKRRRQLRRAFGNAARKQTPGALHNARIAGKKLRYLLELGEESNLAPAENELKLLKDIQKLLGDHHDVHVLLETLHDHLADVGARPPTGTWERFHHRLKREQAKRAGAFFVQSYLWHNR